MVVFGHLIRGSHFPDAPRTQFALRTPVLIALDHGCSQNKGYFASPAGYGREMRDGHLADPHQRLCRLDRNSGDGLLSAYAELYCRIQRKLFAEVSAGWSAVFVEAGIPGALPDTGPYVQRHPGVPGGQGGLGKGAAADGVGMNWHGALPGPRCRSDQAGDGVRGEWLHQKRRRLGNLKSRLEKLESDIESGRIRLCFGSKRSVAQAACPGGQRLFQP